MTAQHIGERAVGAADILRFAIASGDWNPIHVDPIAARRLLAGGVVAHGVDTLLWMLERHLATGGGVPRSLVATFPRPVAPGDVAALRRTDTDGGVRQRLSVDVDGSEAAAALLEPGDVLTPTADLPPQGELPRTEPDPRAFESLHGAGGELRADGVDARDRAAYPELHRALGPRAIAGLHAVSRLVGMHCPGLHSLIAGLQVSFEPSRRDDRLAWQVVRHGAIQAPLRVAFEGSGIAGHVDAFYRPAPVAQAGIDALRAHVVADEFAGQKALVVGGTRGLGELTAKLIAAGGGDVTITHREGGADAARVAAEIERAGGLCRVAPFDAADARRDIDAILASSVPTHVYYFAAPRIGRPKAKVFSASTFRAFSLVFVEGFGHVAAAFAGRGLAVRLFYPSTVFLDDSPADQAEYVAAKAAAEALCTQLGRRVPGLRILTRRLPKLNTDQNAGLLSRGASDPVPPMLQIVRAMHAPA